MNAPTAASGAPSPESPDRSADVSRTHGEAAASIAQGLVRAPAARAETASLCPSEVARALAAPGTDWRAWMAPVREVACALALEGVIRLTRGGQTLDPQALGRGPIRVRRGPRFGSPPGVAGGSGVSRPVKPPAGRPRRP